MQPDFPSGASAEHSRIPRNPNGPPLTAIVWLAVVCLLNGGCATVPSFKASNLPPELMPPPRRGVQQINFSRLASTDFRSEVIQPGDLIEVTIATGLEQTQPAGHLVRVDPNGMAEVPLVGAVRLAGIELTRAQQVVFQESVRRGVYRKPTVSLQLRQRRSHRITVMGAVKEPGVKSIPLASSDLLAALASAGGMTPEADTIVEVRYPALYVNGQLNPPQTVRIDLVEATTRGGDFRLPDGASVTVLGRPLQAVHVLGLVRKPDQFELPQGEDLRLLGALSRAGGRTLQVADKVKIIRKAPNGAPVVIQASVSEAKRNGKSNIRLAPGDVVSVEETPLTFTIETLRSFIRFGFSSAIPGL